MKHKTSDVTILCQYFHPEYISSARLPTELAIHLAENGLKVKVISGWPYEYIENDNVTKREVYKDIEIKRLKYFRIKDKNIFGKLISFFNFFLSVIINMKEFSKTKLLIVYTNPPTIPFVGYLAKKIFGIKLVFVGFDLYPENAIALNKINKENFMVKVINYMNLRVFQKSDAIIAISEDMQSFMNRKYSNKYANKIKVIPNWYTGEIVRDKPITNTEILKIKNKYELVLLYSGNMGEAQDIKTIMDLIKRINETQLKNEVAFVFSGEGTKKSKLIDFSKDNNFRNVFIYDFLHGETYIDMLNMVDYCIVSLEKGIEGLGVPSKTYGYLAYGKPIISIMSLETEISKKINEYSAGLTVIQGDVEKIHAYIKNISQNLKSIEKLKKNSLLLYGDNYTRANSLKKYEEVIKSLINLN